MASPYEHRHPHILTVLVDVPPCVLDDLHLGVGQRLRPLWTVLALPPLHSQHLWRWGRRRWRLPARHPPAPQQHRSSQQRPGEVGSQGGGQGDGELRPHGGSWEESRNEKKSRRRRKRGTKGDPGRAQKRSRRSSSGPPPRCCSLWLPTLLWSTPHPPFTVKTYFSP